MNNFASNFRTFGIEPIDLPAFAGTRIMMMPIRLGEAKQHLVPQYEEVLDTFFSCVEARLLGEVGYLTIDEQILEPKKTLRRPGAHVDGILNGQAGSWGGGSPWAGGGNGMMLVSSTPHCRMYPGIFQGWPGNDGECDHLVNEQTESIDIEAGRIYWCDPLCVYESIPVSETTERQLLRLSLPSVAPWFEGYTENPDGTLPTGPVLPRRTEQMSFKV